MPDVVLIRPGCTDFDEQNRIQGTLDLPLNSRGQEQVDCLVDQLREIEIEVIYSAPTEPARSTATAIGSSLGIPVKEKEGLRNLDQGLWQGLQIDDVRRKYPKVFKQLQDAPESICPPGGETVPEAVARVRKVLAKATKRKEAIGIVACEPLATLIRCVVQDRKLELPDSVCGGSREPLVEVLEARTDGSAADATSKTQNGKEHPPAEDANGDPNEGTQPAEVSARGGNSR